MYQEDLVIKIKHKENVKENYRQLYYSNYNLINTFRKACGVRYSDVDDFNQLAFIALEKAVNAFNESSKFSFMAYFRRCLVHEYYLFRLEMHFPCKMTNSSYKEVKISDNTIAAIDICNVEIHQLDYQFSLVEKRMVADILWSTVTSVLSDKNSFIIKERFIRQRTLLDIGKELGIGAERVRQREKKALAILRVNEVICEIARDYYS